MSIDLGLFLRGERRRQKLTLRQLSEKTGIDYSMLSKYENGIVNPPKEKLNLIATALNISEDRIIHTASIQDIDEPVRRRSIFTRIDEDRFMIPSSGMEKTVLELVGGVCELCGDFFPYGEIFLETHYIRWLNDGGKPTIDNVVALCPNCHKKIHLFNDPDDIHKLQAAASTHQIKNAMLADS